MKRLWMICMACLLCLSLQAEISHKRVVECPAFVTANTSEIEIRKITLTDEQTQVDAVFYGQPGTPAVLSSKTYLQTAQYRFPLREADKVSIDGLTEPEVIPESGRLEVILSFAPVPSGIHEVDFVEMESGWNIWGIQLTETDPYVYVPTFLEEEESVEEQLPDPQLKMGPVKLNGYVLGYDTRMLMNMSLNYNDSLFPEDWQLPVKVRQDGSFHVELDLVKACKARLKVNQAELPLFLLPGEELTVYIHLPALSVVNTKFKNFDEERFLADMNVQVLTAVKICKWLLPKMSKAKFGRVLFMATSYVLANPPKNTGMAAWTDFTRVSRKSAARIIKRRARARHFIPSISAKRNVKCI